MDTRGWCPYGVHATAKLSIWHRLDGRACMLGMPDRICHTADGVQVRLEAWNWTGRPLRRHPSITEPDIAQAAAPLSAQEPLNLINPLSYGLAFTEATLAAVRGIGAAPQTLVVPLGT